MPNSSTGQLATLNTAGGSILASGSNPLKQTANDQHWKSSSLLCTSVSTTYPPVSAGGMGSRSGSVEQLRELLVRRLEEVD
eukprot:940357-Pyramimonas_sp.AAC.1